MEITSTYLALPAIALGLASLAWLVLRSSRRVRHKMTRPGLRKRATAASSSLAAFCNQREASANPRLIAVGGHEIPDPDAEAEDPKALGLYREYHLPEVADLRDQFAERGIREKALDRLYEHPEGVAEIRTVSTGLVVMAARLR